MPVSKQVYSNRRRSLANIDTRTEGRLDTPKRAATGAQQFMKGANKSIREAREKLKGIADNEFIADINVLIADVKNTKDLDSAQKALDRMNSKMNSYFSNKKAIRKSKTQTPILPKEFSYGGKAKMMGGGKVHIKKYAKGGGMRKAMYK